MNFWRITTYNGRGHQWSNTFNEKVPSMGDNQKKFSKAGHPVICLDFIICHRLRSNVNKKNSIFKNIVQSGGKEVNPILKNWKEMIFSQKLEREGVAKDFIWNRNTLFCMIYCSIWPNQGTLSFCLYPWPSESNRDSRECKFQSVKCHDRVQISTRTCEPGL